MIDSSVREALDLRAESVMQYNVPALSRILNRAFEHFAASEKPFDFYLAVLPDIPNPNSMQDHIANFLRHAFEYGRDTGRIKPMVIQVVTIALLVYTYHHFLEG